MPHLPPARAPSIVPATLMVAAVLALGCEGKIGAGGGAGGSGVVTGAGGVTGSGGAGAPPSLDTVATRYFPGQTAGYGGKRMFRLTRAQLDVTVQTLLPTYAGAGAAGVTTAVASVPRDPLQTNYEYADNLGFNPANFAPFAGWAAQIAAAVKARPAGAIDCSSSGNSTACLTEQAKKLASRAFRGTVSDAQLARFSDLFTSSVASVGLPSATADLVDVVLSSPSFAFRDEVQTDATGLLLPAQQLQNITYTLADGPPEAVGLSSATPVAHLQTPDLVGKTVDQVLASPAARAKLLRFFLAWLEVKEPEEFAIAESAFPEFTPDVAAAVVAETKAFLQRQLGSAAPSMKDLTESTQSVLSAAGSFLYGRPPGAATGLVDLDPAQRLGIFSQPAVIASHSGPTTTRLVKRGVFFVRKVMCIPLGAPPSDVATTVPMSAGATERERVETVTAQSKCAGCHAIINPFGFMQENYDAIGRWRTTDDGTPIDASISVNVLDEGPVTTSSPVDALRAFTRSYRFQQCFARQLFRYYLGRDEVAGDDPLLRQMFVEFAGDGRQDIVRMLRTLATAPAFSRRAEVTTP
jgi:hypothetical protein